MSQVDDDIRKAVAAYCAAFRVKAKITLSHFQDGEVQLFLHSPDNPSVTHAQGSGKDIESAAVALKTHLENRLADVRAKSVKALEESQASAAAFHARIDQAVQDLGGGT